MNRAVRDRPTSTKVQGVIKSLKKPEGYGFITHTATGEDYFFHRSALTPDPDDPWTWDELSLDQWVEFDPVEGPKGLRAMAVTPR